MVTAQGLPLEVRVNGANTEMFGIRQPIIQGGIQQMLEQ
jgi:hypothetical protein